MSNTVEYPALPSFKDESGQWYGSKTKSFGPLIQMQWQQGAEIVAQFAAIRKAKQEREGLLETSDHPDAVAYRQAKEKGETTLDRIKNDPVYDEKRAEIKRLQEEIAADIKTRSENVREVVKRSRLVAETSVIGEVLTDTDPTTLGNELQELNDNIKAGLSILASELPAGTAKWTGTSKSAASGSAGSGDGYRPRLASATVDGVSIVGSGKAGFPTFSDVAKSVKGANAGDLGTYFLNSVLGGVKEALSSTTPHVYTQTVNNVEHTFEIMGRAAKEDAEPGTVSHTGTDTANDDEDTSAHNFTGESEAVA